MAPTAEHQRIVQEERLAVLATVRRDGTPQISPVSYAFEDGRFLISTTKRAAKYHNIRRNPGASLCIVRAAGRPYVAVFGRAEVQERDIEEGTATVFRRAIDGPLPDDFPALLQRQRRVLIVVTPERFVP